MSKKLSDEQVKHIKYMMMAGRSNVELARAYDVAPETMSRIRCGLSRQSVVVRGEAVLRPLEAGERVVPVAPSMAEPIEIVPFEEKTLLIEAGDAAWVVRAKESEAMLKARLAGKEPASEWKSHSFEVSEEMKEKVRQITGKSGLEIGRLEEDAGLD